MASGTDDGELLVGIDTGGTFTDAAVVTAAGHRVVATAKALTTKGDLAVGVRAALIGALEALPAGTTIPRIALVSVSTTLATNAVVEGHGDHIGVVLIGFDAAMAERTGLASSFPGVPIALVAGGHDHGGREVAPLDEAALLAAVTAMSASVAAFAVSSTFSTRNPSHERRAAELIRTVTDRPVTMSSELSSGLDAPRRAATAALNARLVGRITSLVAAVRTAMTDLGIDRPMMLVKGDGSLALAESVTARPIETVLSGPAASMVGARWLSGLDDFLLSDVGGTTTDLGIVRGGRPRLAEEGAEVGGWRTMVRAIDVRTIGLGGDSMVSVEGSRVELRAVRVVPISLAATRWPALVGLLEDDLADVRTGGALHGRFVIRPFATAPVTPAGLDDREASVLSALDDGPRPMRELAPTSRSAGVVDSLRRAGLVQVVAFTPSDAAHVLGEQDTWDTGAAMLGAMLGARLLEMRTPTEERAVAFARRVWGEAVSRSARAVVETALGSAVRSPLVDAVCEGRPIVESAEIAVRPVVPVVAVGGPARVIYPEVGRRLASRIVFPDHYAVANAVGAATGAIVRAVRVEVHATDAGYRIHGPDTVETVFDAGVALERAGELASAAAAAAVTTMGGVEPDVRVSIVDRVHIPGRVGDSGLISVTVVAEAIGRPAAC